MLLFAPANDISALGTGITASTQNPYFPAAQIKGSTLACATWRSTTSSAATETLTIALSGGVNSANLPNGIYLLIDYWNANTTCSGVTYTFNGVAPVTVSLTGGASGPGWMWFPIPGSATYTTLTLTFTRTGGPNYVEVGKLYLGVSINTGQSGTPDRNNGFDRVHEELVNKDVAQLGQNFSEMRAVFWSGKLTMPVFIEANVSPIRSVIFDQCGTFTPFWVIILSTDTSTAQFQYPRYVKQVTPASEKLTDYGADHIWTVIMNLKKQL